MTDPNRNSELEVGNIEGGGGAELTVSHRASN